MSSPANIPCDRVPLWRKIAYGAAGPVDIWITWVPLSMASQVFNMSLGLSPLLLTLAFTIFRIYDGLNDPFMGWISDNTRTRWGRRRPYVFVGAILTGLTFPLIWMVNPAWSQAAMAAWLIGTGLVFYTFCTMWAIPYQSLLLEMSPSYHERTTITGVRAFFQNIGTIVVTWVWALTQLPAFADPATGKPDTLAGIRAVSIVLGVIIIALGVLPAIFLREPAYARLAAAPREKIRLVDGFRKTLANRPFRLINVFTILFCFGTSAIGSFGAYVSTYHVFGGDQAGAAVITGLAGTVGLGVAIASLPAYGWFSRRFGKTSTLGGALVLQLLAHGSTWWTYSPEHPRLILVSSALLYVANAGLWMMLPSMTADAVDHDELATGERREGSFAAAYSWVVKLAMTLGFALGGPLLEWTGFDAALGAAQAPGVVTHLRVLLAVVPCALLVGGFAVLSAYPLGATRMDEIRRELERRRGAALAA